MRYLLVAAAILVLGLGAYVMTDGSGDDVDDGHTTEERFEQRDDLVASEALVADIEPGALIEDEVFPAAIGIVLLRETGWTLDDGGAGLPFSVVSRGEEQFAQVQPGCYYAFSAPDEPLPFALPVLPGLDAPLPLDAHPDVRVDREGERVTYQFDPGDGGGPYDATEDLSQIDSGILSVELVRTGEDGTQHRTAYTLREATDDESETARETITSAQGSESAALWGASIWIDEEPGNGSGEWSWPVLRDCPGLYVGGEWIELRPGEQPGDAWVAVGLSVVEWDWDAPHAEQLAAARNPVRRDAPVGYETSFLSHVTEDGFTIVVHMDGCEESEWFHCEEFPEPEER